MQVLIVDCSASKHFPLFVKMVKSAVRRFMKGDGNAPNFIERTMDQLSDYACHWHHDTLDEKCRGIMGRFDRLDIICICGDMSMVPWDPMYMQVITLIFMAYHCKKPIYCCGSAAYAAVYTVATEGTRFHILNGPHGDSLSHLSRFPRYSVGTGPFPSGWLDNHTGDVYLYDRDKKSWHPNCNIAMYRIATSGRPTNNKFQPVAQHYAREDRIRLFADRPEAIEYSEELCFVRNKYLQHYSIRNLPAQEFVSSPLQEWHLHGDAALPPNVGMQAIACCSTGPVIVSCGDTMLMVAIEMSTKSGVDLINLTLNNFVEHSVAALRGNIRGINTSLFVYIFGEHGLGGGTFDSVADLKARSPPLASNSIPSRLPKGPAHLDTPVYGMFFKEVDPGTFDLTALMSPRTSSSMGRPQVNVLRDPQMNHAKRMASLLNDSGYRGLDKVLHKALDEGQSSSSLSGAFLDSTKAAMSGRIIHTNNIRGRRQPTFRMNDGNQAPAPAKGTVRGTSTFILASSAERGDGQQNLPVQMNMGIFNHGGGPPTSQTAAGQPTHGGKLSPRPKHVVIGGETTISGPHSARENEHAGASHGKSHSIGIHDNNATGWDGGSRRPSSANAVLMPKHHPRIRKHVEEEPAPLQPSKPLPIYFIDDDEDGGDESPAINATRPARPLRASSAKFVQPSRTVYINQKAGGNISASRKLSTVNV